MQALDFQPDRPIGTVPEWRSDVTLVPWGLEEPRGARRAAGLFDAQGQGLSEGQCWRQSQSPITVLPERDPAQTPRPLPGRWLFGGLFYGHFGHFLCETTSRLWALDALDGVDGILFYPKIRLTHERRMTRHLAPFFDALGLGHLELLAPQTPVAPEAIAIPEPGFGIHDMIEGRPEYRDFIRRRLGREIPATGAERIYLSRAHLPAKRGSVLQEAQIEAHMAAAGYDILCPEQLPIAEQIARYKAARQVVALDGSALHLAAMVIDPSAQVAILNRGPSENIDDYVRQFRAFAGIEALRLDHVTGFWFEQGRRVVRRETHAVLDLPALGAGLVAGGFLPQGTHWPQMGDEALRATVVQMEERLQVTLAWHEARE